MNNAKKRLLLSQSELRKQETDLKSLVNSINDIILEVDSKGYITTLWSKTHPDIYQLYIQGNLNSIDDLLDKNTAKIAREKIVHVIKTKETVTIDFNIESTSNLKWFEASISPRLNDSNKVVVSCS